MDVIKILRKPGRSAVGRRILRMRTGEGNTIMVPEWCSNGRPVTADRVSAPVYDCMALYDENGMDAFRHVTPRQCVRCKFCRFYSVYNMVACRRMWDMDFYGRGPGSSGSAFIRPLPPGVFKPAGADMVMFGRKWRRGITAGRLA